MDLDTDEAIHTALTKFLDDPDDELLELLFQRIEPTSGASFEAASDGFRASVKRVFATILDERVDARLRAALLLSSVAHPSPVVAPPPKGVARGAQAQPPLERPELIVTTQEELDGYAVVRELVGDILPPARLSYRDRERYFGIIVDADERQTLCRLHFNRVRKYVGIFSDPTTETKRRVEGVEAIHELRTELRAAAGRWVTEAS